MNNRAQRHNGVAASNAPEKLIDHHSERLMVANILSRRGFFRLVGTQLTDECFAVEQYRRVFSLARVSARREVLSNVGSRVGRGCSGMMLAVSPVGGEGSNSEQGRSSVCPPLDNHVVPENGPEEPCRRSSRDPWADRIAPWLEAREMISVREVLELCLQKTPEQCSQACRNYVARYLLANGWRRYQQRTGPGGMKREWR